MRAVYSLFSCATAFLLWAPVAVADLTNDPALFENGLGCAGVNWCAGSGLKLDPLSGITTVYYELNTSFIPTVVAGDVKVTEPGGAVGDVIRFEMIAGTPYVFVYSNDAGQPSDVGLPGSFQSNVFTITENSNGVTSLYTPTSSEPGYTGLAAGQYKNTAYQLSDAPEPVFGYVLGAFLVAVVGGTNWRRRVR